MQKRKFLCHSLFIPASLANIVLSIFWFSNVHATTVLSQSVSAVTSRAVWVGRVKVVELKVTQGTHIPSTEVKAEIQEVFKGQGESLQMISTSVPGGQVSPERNTVVVGVPSFLLGEEYILFLKSNPVILSSDETSTQSQPPELVDWSAFHIVQKGDNSKVVIRSGETTFLNTVRGNAFFEHARATRYEDFVGQIFRAQE
jgi:hypothetical protein